MIAERLKRHLEENGVPFIHHVHRTVYTTQQVAAEEHVPGRMVAKTVVVHTGEEFLMVVLPAPMRVDWALLRNSLNKPQARLATEAEFASLFPDSETGAMPPFGNLYGMKVYVDESLTRTGEIVFNAGTHRDTIRMGYNDFARLVRPAVLPVALRRAVA